MPLVKPRQSGYEFGWTFLDFQRIKMGGKGLPRYADIVMLGGPADGDTCESVMTLPQYETDGDDEMWTAQGYQFGVWSTHYYARTDEFDQKNQLIYRYSGTVTTLEPHLHLHWLNQIRELANG